MRVLFITPPGSGQINPFAALGRELVKRGHAVTWAVALSAVERIRTEGFVAVAAGPSELDFENRERYSPIHAALTGWTEFVHTGVELIVGPTRRTVQDLRAAFQASDFDVIVGDISAPAARILAELWGLPWVCICTTSLSLASSEIPLYAFEDERNDGAPVSRYLDGHEAIRTAFNDVRASFDLAPVRQGWNDLFSERLTVVCSAPDIEYPRAELERLAFVGAMTASAEAFALSPAIERFLGRFEAEGVVYATLGTAFNRHGNLMRTLIEGSAASGLPVLVSTGPGFEVPIDLATSLPERVLVVSWADHAALFPRIRAVVSHGGMGTCNDAIRHGLPMLNIPIGCDHPSATLKLAAYGMSLRLKLGEASAATIAEKMRELATTPVFGVRARALGKVWNALGGAPRAAVLVETAVVGASQSKFRMDDSHRAAGIF